MISRSASAAVICLAFTPKALQVDALGLNFTQCAIDIVQNYPTAPTDNFLLDQSGKPTINPEALELGNERFEERPGFVTVFRVLSKEEVHQYADRTAQIRQSRDHSNNRNILRAIEPPEQWAIKDQATNDEEIGKRNKARSESIARITPRGSPSWTESPSEHKKRTSRQFMSEDPNISEYGGRGKLKSDDNVKSRDIYAENSFISLPTTDSIDADQIWRTLVSHMISIFVDNDHMRNLFSTYYAIEQIGDNQGDGELEPLFKNLGEELQQEASSIPESIASAYFSTSSGHLGFKVHEAYSASSASSCQHVTRKELESHYDRLMRGNRPSVVDLAFRYIPDHELEDAQKWIEHKRSELLEDRNKTLPGDHSHLPLEPVHGDSLGNSPPLSGPSVLKTSASEQAYLDANYEWWKLSKSFQAILFFVRSSKALRTFQSQLVHLIWVRAHLRWTEEYPSSSVPFNLTSLLRVKVDILSHDPLRLGDYAKRSCESYTGMRWDWRPFGPPRRPLAPDKRRLQWKCGCGQIRRMDVSKTLADIYVLLRARGIVSATQPSSPSSSISSMSDLSGTTAASSMGSKENYPVNEGPADGSPERIQSTYATPSIQDATSASLPRYVLLCVFRGFKLLPTQIEVPQDMTDDCFIQQLRHDYKTSRGFWRYWFSPQQFGFCEFRRFRKIQVRRVVKEGEPELPKSKDYSYIERTDGTFPPIGEHEWQDWFHCCDPFGSLGNSLALIPKRNQRFQLDIHRGPKEDIWGLYVKFYVSCSIFLFWFFATSLLGVVFWVLWAEYHPDQLDTASIPLTIIVASYAAVIVPLNTRFQRPM